jgi:Secretion system C-terminal sorting domain
MHKIFTLLCTFIATASFAQSFNSPESVEYDDVYQRWLVGNNGSGDIVSYYPQSNTTIPFASGLTSGPHGIEILGNTAYVCDGARIKGFDLATGTQNFNLNLGASFLNGLTSDGSTYLFATDFSAKKIYRINTVSSTYNLMATTIKTPNGIYYDGANNRCVFVTWGSSAPIQAMSMLDSTISTLLATTLSNCDGITRDNAGFWYVTAWGTNALHRVDPTFSAAPVNVMSGLTGPADIDINTAGDSIGIPNSGNANNVVFYTGITTATDPTYCGPIYQLNAMPNPANHTTTITTREYYSTGTIEIMDATGRLVRKENFYGNYFTLDISGLSSGVYMLRLYSTMEGDIETLKLFVD